MPLITNFAAASARAFGLGASSRYTLTSGNYSFFDTGTGVNYDITGFNSTNSSYPGIGSILPAASSIYGTAITDLYTIALDDTVPTSVPGNLVWSVLGTQANSGWTTMTIYKTGSPLALARTSATFSTSGGFSYWTWTTASTGSYIFPVSGPVGVTWS